MWAFNDKGNRPVCLIPEVTAIVQQLWREEWSKQYKTRKIFYVNRCYRYERPQAGRYREFTQFGVEVLGEVQDGYNITTMLLKNVLDQFPGLKYDFCNAVKRGLTYYIEDGFEVECGVLGAQKQIAGGGRYAEGIGWAIGVDRLLLAIDRCI